MFCMNKATKTAAVMVGCGIGDALGATFEFLSPRDPQLTEWKGRFCAGGPWGLAAGQWTDDTHMAIGLAETLVGSDSRWILQTGARLDATMKRARDRYVQWLRSGDLRGIGNTCAAALRTGRPGEGQFAAGNGTAMRVAPVGLFAADLSELVTLSVADADITHKNTEARAGSIAVAYGVRELARLDPTDFEGRARVLDRTINILGLLGRDIARSQVRRNLIQARRLGRQYARREISLAAAVARLGTSGYVVHTVAASFFCLCATKTFKDAVVAAVKGGNDTDTTGAITGALAGAFYGLGGIPRDYLAGVEALAHLQHLDRCLAQRTTDLR